MQMQHSPSGFLDSTTCAAGSSAAVYSTRRARSVGGSLAVACLPFMLLVFPGCASKPPDPVAAAAASEGSGAQTIGPTGLRRVLGKFAPFRISVQQGNFVSSEMLANLKVGMTQEQVRFALGTPLLIDPFHTQRWDYIFRLQRGSGEVTTSRVSVFFKDNVVASYQGGDLPTEVEYLARITGGTPPPKELPAVGQPKTVPSAPQTR